MSAPLESTRDEPRPASARRAHELRPPAGTALYVHLPFCRAKCTYCDFYSVADEGQDLTGTMDALLAEAERRAPPRPETVFLGGGTPSLYPTDELARLLDTLHRASGFRDSAAEVTLEANPESLDLEKARALRDLGVNRLSIGVQSLDPAVLKLFGRVHDAEQGLAALETARAAGFRRVSADLIYAAPGQPLEAWLRDLDRVLDLGPDHVSAYHLAYEQGTLLTRWKEEGDVAPWGEEAELAFFLATRRRLEERGLPPYEVSNFAVKEQQCRHNLNYWRNGPYVGLGPSAVSQLAGTRFGNPRSVHQWRQRIDAGEPAASWEETLEPGERLGETWWLGLRTERGIDPSEAEAGLRLGGEAARARSLADELVTQGFLERRDGRYRLSKKGLPLADAVARRFLQRFEGPSPQQGSGQAVIHPARTTLPLADR